MDLSTFFFIHSIFYFITFPWSVFDMWMIDSNIHFIFFFIYFSFNICCKLPLTAAKMADTIKKKSAAVCLVPSGQDDSGENEACDNFTDLNLSHCLMGTSLYVRLLLYTRSNLDCGREINHHNLSSQPLFDLSRPTAFVIHGYRPTGAPPIWINHLVNLMAEQEDMNVIVVDWNRGAANLNYFTAVIYTREAAHNLTGFIMNMEVRVNTRNFMLTFF